MRARKLQLAEGADARQSRRCGATRRTRSASSRSFRPTSRNRSRNAFPCTSCARRSRCRTFPTQHRASVWVGLAAATRCAPRGVRRRRPSSCGHSDRQPCSDCRARGIVVIAPGHAAERVRADLVRHATPASYEVWQWLTIRAGVPVITAATQDLFVAQTANSDLLAGIDFQEGLLHRAGDHRPDAVPGSTQGARVRLSRRLAEGLRRRAPVQRRVRRAAVRHRRQRRGRTGRRMRPPRGAAARGGRSRRRPSRCADRSHAGAALPALRHPAGR